jgi:hypothetical protein
VGSRKRTGRLCGGYGGAKGIGYLLGPIAGGALVVANGNPALFGTLAAGLLACAALAAPRTRVSLPHSPAGTT